MSERLTSRSNPLFVHLHKLQTSRSYRAETRQFCADGVKLLDEAVRWYPGLRTVIACDGIMLPDLSEDEELIFRFVQNGKKDIDEISAHCSSFTPSKLAGLLLSMELKGVLYALPGKSYSTQP